MKSMHYWRIHARIAKRLFMKDINQRTYDTIAHDVEGSSEESKWVKSKLEADTTRLYEDGNYYDNAEATFRYPRSV